MRHVWIQAHENTSLLGLLSPESAAPAESEDFTYPELKALRIYEDLNSRCDESYNLFETNTRQLSADVAAAAFRLVGPSSTQLSYEQGALTEAITLRYPC